MDADSLELGPAFSGSSDGPIPRAGPAGPTGGRGMIQS